MTHSIRVVEVTLRASRQGAAIITVFLLVSTMFVMGMIIWDHWQATTTLSRGLESRQKAGNAAETVAAMVEDVMVSSMNFDELCSPMEMVSGKLWNLAGCDYVDTEGKVHRATTGLFVNGCLVRWRVEPLTIYDTTNVAAEPANVFINPGYVSDVEAWRKSPAVGAVPTSVNNPKSVGYYFRITAEAYAMADTQTRSGSGLLVTTATPWSRRSGHNEDLFLARAQTKRAIQFQPRSLFDYALIHLDEDLVIQTGVSITISQGSVHSNRNIFVNGGEFNGFNKKDYHLLASGDSYDYNQQWTRIGDDTNRLQVSAVGGIFRTGKLAMLYHYLNNVYNRTTNPFNIPTLDQLGSNDPWIITPGYNLNGDSVNPKCSRVQINGKNLLSNCDSRTPTSLHSKFDMYVRDRSDNVNAVTFDNNVTKGWPLEAQELVKTGMALYDNGVGGLSLFVAKGGNGQVYYDGGDSQYPFVPSNDPRIFSQTTATFKDQVPALKDVGRKDFELPGSPTGKPQNWTDLTMRPMFILDKYYPCALTTNPTNDSSGNPARPVSALDMPLWYNVGTANSKAYTKVDVIPPDTLSYVGGVAGVAYDWGASSINQAQREMAYFSSRCPSFAPSSPGPTPYDVVSPTAPAPATMVDAAGDSHGVHINTSYLIGTGFSRFEKAGKYLSMALFNKSADAYYRDQLNAATYSEFIKSTGLTIRELPTQRWVNWTCAKNHKKKGGGYTYDHVLEVTNQPMDIKNYPVIAWPDGVHKAADVNGDKNPPTLTDYLIRPAPSEGKYGTISPLDRIAMVRYLCSNYNVLFMGRNVTAEFFSQILTASNYGELIAAEDQFVDARESLYLAMMYRDGDANVVFNPMDRINGGAYKLNQNPTSTLNYRVNTLTLSLKATMDWLRNGKCTSLDPLKSISDFPADAFDRHFNGVIYVHRTRRSFTYHPLFAPFFRWGTPNSVSAEIVPPEYRAADSVIAANVVDKNSYPYMINYAFRTDIRGDGTSDYQDGSISPNPPWNGGANPNYPWNWREGSGPVETMCGAVRIRGQIGDEPSSSTDDHARVWWNSSSKLNKNNGLTIITPNRLYVWGNFNTVSLNSSSTEDTAYPPCSLWSDSLTALSPNWLDKGACYKRGDGGLLASSDSGGASFPLAGTYNGIVVKTAANVTINASAVQNNVYTDLLTAQSFGGTITDTYLRPLESCGGITYAFTGSMVFLRECRYTHSVFGYANNATSFLNHATRVYSPPANKLTFNTDLTRLVGQPPATPYGATAKCIASSTTLFGD